MPYMIYKYNEYQLFTNLQMEKLFPLRIDEEPNAIPSAFEGDSPHQEDEQHEIGE